MRKLLSLLMALVLLAGVLLGCAQPQPAVVKETVPVPQTVVVPAEGAAGTSDDQELITVLNPTGFPPPIEGKSMAVNRPASLDGQTVYLVDVTFSQGDRFLAQMQRWFTENMPEVKTEFRVKAGAYSFDDKELWEEIKAANGVVIMAIGH